ncbi:MAG TPA: response regulator [Thermomicrobiales bacterium]|nr:response regulator [Thermomicrobiales bacterium]
MKRVLVVDDEPFIRQVIGDVLQDEGYDALFASSGHAMLKLLETEHPDLVLLDLMMPDGDGQEALQAMQSQPHLADIPVVVVSTGVARQRLDGVTVRFLAKPFDLDKLLQIVIDTIGPALAPE